MQKIDRPDPIKQILQTVCSIIDSESYAEFKAYLNNLEKKQDLYNTASDSTPKWNSHNPPTWSHERQMVRAQKRHARMLKKLPLY